MSKKNDDKQTVVVVGGGAAGVAVVASLASQLDPSKYHIVIVNPLPYRILLPATIRMNVSPRDNIQESVFVPYDKLFSKNNGEFILGSVASIDQKPGDKKGVVVLESGDKIPYVCTFEGLCHN